MTTAEAAVIVAAVFAMLAIVAWAGAWRTLEWLGDAEDLIERCAADDYDGRLAGLHRYVRRTPRRSR